MVTGTARLGQGVHRELESERSRCQNSGVIATDCRDRLRQAKTLEPEKALPHAIITGLAYAGIFSAMCSSENPQYGEAAAFSLRARRLLIKRYPRY